MEWFTDAVRSFFATLDGIVYGLMTILYQLFLDLTNIDILSNDVVSEFYTKIYVLLGLFMLVKVSFSFINYIVNPDSFLDKTQGAQKVLLNVILTLTMLTVAPFAFSMLAKVQSAILEDNTIPMFFLGEEGDNTNNYTFTMNELCDPNGNNPKPKAASQADYLALLSFRPFYQPNTDKFGDFEGVTDDLALYCVAFENATIKTYLHSSIYNVSEKSQWYQQQGENSNFSDDEKYYIIDYQVFLSTAVGAFICLLLISFCFDIAVRSIKLGFLELIAPIPIVSFIDPKSGKNGMFNKWLKEVGTTWLDLFIRMSAVFLAIYIINLATSNQIDYGDAQSSKFWLLLFIILGALMFAKKLPELIQGVFGIKLSGLQLNPFKKVQSEALFGKQIVGATGAVAAGAAGLAVGGVTHGLAFANKLKTVNQAKNKLRTAEANLSAARAPRDAIQGQINTTRDQISKIQERKKDLTRQWIMSNDPQQKAKLKADWKKADAGLNNKNAELAKLEADKAQANQAVAAAATKVKDQRENVENAKSSKLYRRPVRGTVTEAATSAVTAMKSGYSNPGHVFKNATAGRKAGVDKRNYYEQFSFADRVRDKYTDVVGITNDTGTTSETKKAIKERSDSLVRIEDYIKMLNKNLTDIAGKDFHNAVTVNNKGVYEFNKGYTGPNYNEIQATVTDYNNAMNQKFALEKEIKKLEGIKNTGSGFMKPPKK